MLRSDPAQLGISTLKQEQHQQQLQALFGSAEDKHQAYNIMKYQQLKHNHQQLKQQMIQ